MTAGGTLDVVRLVIRAGTAVFDHRFWVPGPTGPTGPCIPAGLTGRDLAARAGWHDGSRVSKIEHGIRPPSSDDVRMWCQVCGVPRERAEELLAEQRAVAGMWVS